MVSFASLALLGLVFAPDAQEALSPQESDETPWIAAHRPRRNMFHLGVFGGVFLPARDIELFEIDTSDAEQGFRAYRRVAPEVGGRFGYFPLDFLGLEVEGAFGFGQVEGDQSAGLWAARGHVLGQIPRWSVTPFVLAGAGALGVRSSQSAVGNDTDLAFHVGAGLMVHITRALSLRLDVRNAITPQQGPSGGSTNNPEILLGIGWTRRPRQAEPRPEPAATPPPSRSEPPSDLDSDGVWDDEDACPAEPGSGADGCPVPEPEPAVEPQPEPEPKPAEVPAELRALEGKLDGVDFRSGSAKLRPDSQARLDEVAAVLAAHPSARLQISGHTDSSGAWERNAKLSTKRAEAVKTYLTDQGIAADRIETRGAGPDEPIDTNATAEGRANNRRIEFRLLD